MLLVADAALEVIPDDVTAIGGLTMGADAVAFGIAAIAATRGRALRSFSVRKEVKDHGGGGRIAGALEPGDRVVITEDAVTRGVSMLEAAEVIRDEGGAEPVLLLPVVDRGGTVRGDGGRARPPAAGAGDRPRPRLPLRGLTRRSLARGSARIASMILGVSTNSSASSGPAKG